MKIRTAEYYVQEVFRSLRRNNWMTFAAVGTVAVSLFILGVFLILALNMNRAASMLESQVQISVYMKDDLAEGEEEEIGAQIRALQGIESVQYVSREEARTRLADRLGELGGPGVLEQETGGSGAQPGEGVLVQVEGGQDEYARARALLGDALGGLDAVHARHAHVHEDDVGVQGPGLGQGGGAVGGLADDGDVLLGLQHHAEAHAHERLVVGEHDADRAADLAGALRPDGLEGVAAAHRGVCHEKVPSSCSSQRRTARTRQPVGVGPACTVPP